MLDGRNDHCFLTSVALIIMGFSRCAMPSPDSHVDREIFCPLSYIALLQFSHVFEHDTSAGRLQGLLLLLSACGTKGAAGGGRIHPMPPTEISHDPSMQVPRSLSAADPADQPPPERGCLAPPREAPISAWAECSAWHCHPMSLGAMQG